MLETVTRRKTSSGAGVTFFAPPLEGVGKSESVVRAKNLSLRAEASDRAVLTNSDGNIAIAPIIHWSYEDVFTYLGYCANGLEETYSDCADVIKLYRDATGECVMTRTDERRPSTSCSARTGCYVCAQSKHDRSLNQMATMEEHAYMQPLARFRSFIVNSFNDLSRRNWVGRTIDNNGYIKFGVDGYNGEMLKELVRYALSIDIEEREAAAGLGIAPRFQIISLEALIAIDAQWSLQAIALPFTCLKLYRDIRDGARYPVPEIAEAPKAPIPPARYIYVGDRGWNQGFGLEYTGLRDPVIESLGGSGCVGTRQINAKGESLTVMDVGTEDIFSVNAESAGLLLEFELDRLVDEWHGPNAPRHARMEGHHIAGAGYRFYLSYGTISLAKNHIAKADEILRRSAFRERIGLAGYQYDHDQAMAMSVEAPVPVLPTTEELRFEAVAATKTLRDEKRRALRQKRMTIVNLYQDWAPDVPWRRLVQRGLLRMPTIPRGRQGKWVLRHLITPYDLLAFLEANPLILQRVRHHRRRPEPSIRDLFQDAA